MMTAISSIVLDADHHPGLDRGNAVPLSSPAAFARTPS
jgi:hypothetical protein